MFNAVQRKTRKILFHLGLRNFKACEYVPLPADIQLEPTVRCNLSCRTCSRDKEKNGYKKMDLALPELDTILSFFPALRTVKLQGLGEPFLHPQIEEVLKRINQKNALVWTISNGTLFNTEKYRKLILKYVADICVSLDAADDQIFRQMRGDADINAILRGTKQLIEERDAQKGGRNVAIGINSVICHQNYGEIGKMYDLALHLKVDYISMTEVENWMIPQDIGFEDSAKFVAQARKYSPQIEKSVRSLSARLLTKGILVSYKRPARRLGSCYWPFKSMFITVEGLVTPCCIRMHRGHAFGNILEAGSLRQIWSNQQYRDLRKSHMARDFSNYCCGNCPD